MITRWGVDLPEAADLPALPRGVVLHWTGGPPRANAVDLNAYHYVVESDGRILQGVHPVADNMRSIDDGQYAAHTGGWNSYRVGISGAGMYGYQSPAKPGSAPLTAIQVMKMLELSAYFLKLGNLDPLNPLHLCTHREVWLLHGVKGTRNHQKLDIEYLPFKPELPHNQIGPFLRRTTAEIMGAPKGPVEIEIAPHKPTIAVPAPVAPDPPNLALIEIPRPDHIDRLARMKGIAGDVLGASGKEMLELVETFGRRVLAGGNVDLKEFIDVLADRLKANL
jgi:hypothetical protein